MLENGFVKLFRSLLHWEWYDDIETKTVFLHLLLTVSIEDSNWHGITICRGSRVASYAKLAEETTLSVRKVRTAIKHLESTGEVTRSTCNKFTVFTVKNFDKFQSVTSQTTSSRQASDKQVTSKRQQYKKVKEDKESKRSVCVPSGTPGHTPAEISEMISRLGYAWDAEEVQRFLEYNDSTGWKCGAEYAARRWEEKRRAAPGKTGREELTAEDRELMESYMGLSNRFRKEDG